ncbi:threonine/serine ThrE exporter family protein [Cellulomonas triticagri]|uniref:Threonine/serine exporter family protein n=1 Tax=Cellulomonas triticagri TaxID=2483352 RepID=A0A3M2JI03_9CELL|nr:threonine/serine exporter family protein [Cellulomonas triticagri]RMI13392.1 threonine/serine exporter family protein [Cellulomonas triticagri]
MRRTRAVRGVAVLVVLVLALAGLAGAVGALSAGAATAPDAPAAVVDDPAVEAPEAPAATPAPTPSPSSSPAPSPGPTVAPTPRPTGQPEPEPVPTSPATPEPTPTPSTEPSPSPSPTVVTPPQDDAGSTTRRFFTPPAVTTTTTPWGQLLGALAVVVAGAVAVVAIATRRSRTAAATAAAAPDEDDAPTAPLTAPASPADVLRLLVAAGEAMVDAGHTVSSVADELEEIATAHGLTGTETVVLPTALLVSVPDGSGVATAVVSAGRRPLLLHQVDDLTDVLRDATSGTHPPAAVRARIAFLRAATPPFGALARLGGYLMLSVGLAALLGGTWVDLLVAGGLGLAVGAVQLVVAPTSGNLEVVLTVATAFAVSAVVLLLGRVVPELGVLPSLVAPLVLFLPGGLLTTGVIELATGQMLSGAGRVAAGTMQLALLAGGIVGAAALVGVPAVDLDAQSTALGPVTPWLGVALFGAGTVVFRCGRPRTIGWVVLVLAVAYGAQVLGDALFGGVLSALVGALAMTPVALAVARFPSGPSPLVSFLPAFWLLVPGALGLVGVTSLLEGDSGGLSTLVTTAATMVAIALGVVVGLAAARSLPGRVRLRRTGVPAALAPDLADGSGMV